MVVNMATTLKLPLLDLRAYQSPIWNYMVQEKPGLRGVTVWPRRNGKDLTAVNILAAKALQRPGTYYYIAPYANQVRSIIWEGSDGTGTRFRDYIPRELVARVLDQSMKIWLKNGSLIQLLGSDNPDAIVGTNPLGIIFTEYSLHKDAVWQYMRPVLAENGGWALFNGTPRGMNHFYRMAQMAKENPSWFYERLTADDTGYPSKEDIEEERQAGMPESLIEQEFYTSWTSSSEETLIPLEKVHVCVNTHLLPSQYSFAERVMGIDPAFSEKGDRAAIACRQGRKVFPVWKTRGIDPMALASEAARQIDLFQPSAVYVDAGRGEAVWSRLNQLGYSDIVIPVDFGGATHHPLYHRVKDEIWGKMKKAICSPSNPVDLPDSSDLIRDLTAPTFEINEKGELVIESKKSLKSRGFRSTDEGDAVALTYRGDEDQPEQIIEGVRTHSPEIQAAIDAVMLQQKKYDPLGYIARLQGRSQ